MAPPQTGDGGGSPAPLKTSLFGDHGRISSKKRDSNVKIDIVNEILSRDRVDMSTIGFEPKISSYVEAVARRGLVSSSGVCHIFQQTVYFLP